LYTDVHRHLLAGPEDDVGLDGSRPSGDPLRRVARAVVSHHQQMIQIIACPSPPASARCRRAYSASEKRGTLLDDPPAGVAQPQHFSARQLFGNRPAQLRLVSLQPAVTGKA